MKIFLSLTNAETLKYHHHAKLEYGTCRITEIPPFRCIHQICIYECTYRSIHKHIHLHHHSWWTINFYFIFIRLLTFAPSPTRDYKLGEDFVSRESTKTIFDLSQFQRFTNQPLEGVVKTISKIRTNFTKSFSFM